MKVPLLLLVLLADSTRTADKCYPANLSTATVNGSWPAGKGELCLTRKDFMLRGFRDEVSLEPLPEMISCPLGKSMKDGSQVGRECKNSAGTYFLLTVTTWDSGEHDALACVEKKNTGVRRCAMAVVSP